jgi:hypothetical protein
MHTLIGLSVRAALELPPAENTTYRTYRKATATSGVAKCSSMQQARRLFFLHKRAEG